MIDKDEYEPHNMPSGFGDYTGLTVTALLKGEDSLSMDIYFGPKLVLSFPVSFSR